MVVSRKNPCVTAFPRNFSIVFPPQNTITMWHCFNYGIFQCHLSCCLIRKFLHHIPFLEICVLQKCCINIEEGIN